MKTINIPYEEYLELKRLAEATNVEELEKIVEQQKSEIKTVGDLLESVRRRYIQSEEGWERLRDENIKLRAEKDVAQHKLTSFFLMPWYKRIFAKP